MSERDAAFFRQWAWEKRIRTTATGQIVVATARQPLDVPPFLQPGSLLIAWSLDLARLRSAAAVAASGESPAEDLAGNLNDLAPGSLSGDLFSQTPAFSAIRYRGRDLIDPAIVPPAAHAVGSVLLPWVGVPLQPDEFSIVSWLMPGGEPLNAMIVCNPPQMDDDERRLIAQLPDEVAELGVEPLATPAVVATVVATALAERAVNEAVDATARKYKAWAADQRRDLVAAEKRAALHQQAERARWRNAASAPRDPSPLGHVAPSAGATIEELLARRILALQPQPPAGQAEGEERGT